MSTFTSQEIGHLQLLLSLSMEIPHLRARNDLNCFIKEKISAAFYFYHCTITILSEDGHSFRAFMLDPQSRVKSHKDYGSLISTYYPVRDGINNLPLETDGAVLVDLEAMAQAGPLPTPPRMIYETGIIEAAGVTLFHDQRPFGVLWFFSDKKGSFTAGNLPLIEGISRLISPAVATIIATETIADQIRERENQLLISNALALVKDRRGLLEVINREVRQVFHFTYSLALHMTPRRDHLSIFLLDPASTSRATPGYDQLISTPLPIGDGIINTIFDQKRPAVLDIGQEVSREHAPSYVRLYAQSGIAEIAIVPLYDTEGLPVGAIVFCADTKGLFDEKALQLMHAVSFHFSTTILNILSSEQIQEQLKQINAYKEQLEEEKGYLQEEVSSGYTYSDIVGSGPAMQKVFHQLSQVSFTESTVLILGETGTGKELIARAIHHSSPRKNKLMVKVNCAAIPANLIESELFGHEKGSFTGATERRIGKFELANHGTLFLDEIGEMPVEMQVKLLRALQEREIERIGGKGTIRLNVRIIAATNRHLPDEVSAGRFRSDLFYRLNVFPIIMPPLRDRKEDLPALVHHFLEKFARLTGRVMSGISAQAMKQVMAYDWPGNVRELEHLLERSILMTKGPVVKKVHIPLDRPVPAFSSVDEEPLLSLEDHERNYILKVLTYCGGKIYGPGGAAEILKINYSTLNSRIRKLGLEREKIVYKKKTG